MYSQHHVIRVGESMDSLGRLFVIVTASVVKTLFISDAYFDPDRQMRRALREAAQRGVDVRLLLPRQSDVPDLPVGDNVHFELILSRAP